MGNKFNIWDFELVFFKLITFKVKFLLLFLVSTFILSSFIALYDFLSCNFSLSFFMLDFVNSTDVYYFLAVFIENLVK